MNYGVLKTTVAAYLHRTDLATPIPDFIEQARVRIGADLRGTANYLTGTVTSFSAGLASLPANLSRIVAVTLDGVPLRYTSPAEVDYNYGSGVYSIIANKMFIPDAGSTTSAKLTYYGIPTALSADPDVGLGMAEWPMLWISAAVAEGAVYIQDFDLATQMNGIYNMLIETANRAGVETRIGPAPAVVNSDANVIALNPGL